MSGLNPNIILGAQRPKFASPFDIAERGAAMQQNQLAARMGEMKMKQFEQEQADDQTQRGIYSKFGADTTANQNMLMQAGLGKQALAYGETQAKAKKAQVDTEKAQIEKAFEIFKVSGQIMTGVQDQATWDRARQQTAEIFGPEAAAKMPAQYDPALVQQKQAQALSMKEQLEQKWKAMEYTTPKADARLSAETSRANNAANNAVQMRGQNLTDARGRESNDIARTKSGAAGPDGRPAKPMPATALKMQNEALDMIGIASSIQADLGTIEQQIAKGKLDFGPVKNLVNNAKNSVGMSDEQSRNLSTFKSSMEKLRNDSLRLNKGVQTDGDAQRAWNELFQNINDKELVKQRLSEIKAINSRAVDLRKREVEDIRNNYNQQQYNFGAQTNVPSAITPPAGGANIDALLEKYK